jgi:hypothetical protein
MRFFVIAAALVIALGARSIAQQPPHQIFTQKLFTISKCDAQENVTTSGGGYYGGFYPGFYPGGPYYWRDPYGVGYYQPPMTSSSPTMYVDFTNITHKTMTGIVWGLIANGHLVAEAKDVGKFSPGVEIKKKYAISNNVFPLQTGLPQCVALGVKWADGTKTLNPNLPERVRRMYSSPPPGAGPPQSPEPPF